MTSTFELPVGFTHRGPTVSIDDDVLDLVRGIGGYTHPLFNDLEWVRSNSPFDRHPVPGPFLLFLLGGMAEQTGLFDDRVIALIGMDDARFLRPAFPGDELTFELEVLGHERSPGGGRGSVRFRWAALRGDDLVCDVAATMLFDLSD